MSPSKNQDSLQAKAKQEKKQGDEAYKKQYFGKVLVHYEKAIKLDPSNISYITNKAGKSFLAFCIAFLSYIFNFCAYYALFENLKIFKNKFLFHSYLMRGVFIFPIKKLEIFLFR